MEVQSPIVFLHFPKTGGTSFHTILSSNFPRKDVHRERFNNLCKYTKEQLEGYKLYSGHYDWANVECIPGPKRVVAFFREPKQRILSLFYFWKSHKWEAIERGNLTGPRLIKNESLLQFLQHRGDAVAGNINNIYARNLLGELYIGPNDEYKIPERDVLGACIDRLESMTAFGIMEMFDKSAKHILVRLDLPVPEEMPRERTFTSFATDDKMEPVEREDVTRESELELERLTVIDQEIYDWAKSKFLSRDIV